MAKTKITAAQKRIMEDLSRNDDWYLRRRIVNTEAWWSRYSTNKFLAYERNSTCEILRERGWIEPRPFLGVEEWRLSDLGRSILWDER